MSKMQKLKEEFGRVFSWKQFRQDWNHWTDFELKEVNMADLCDCCQAKITASTELADMGGYRMFIRALAGLVALFLLLLLLGVVF